MQFRFIVPLNLLSLWLSVSVTYCQTTTTITIENKASFESYWEWDTGDVVLKDTFDQPSDPIEDTDLPSSSSPDFWYLKPKNSNSFFTFRVQFDIEGMLCDMSEVSVHVKYFSHLAAVNVAYVNGGSYEPLPVSSGNQWSTVWTVVDLSNNIEIYGTTLHPAGYFVFDSVVVEHDGCEISTGLCNCRTTTTTEDSTTSPGNSTPEIETSTVDYGSSTPEPETSTVEYGSSTIDSGSSTAESETTTVENGSSTIDSGSSTVDSGSSTVDSGSSTVDSGSSTVDSGSSTVDSGSSTVDSGSSTVDSGSSTVDSGSSTVDSGSSTVDSGSSTVDIGSSPIAPSSSTVYSTSSTIDPVISTVGSGSSTSDSGITTTNSPTSTVDPNPPSETVSSDLITHSTSISLPTTTLNTLHPDNNLGGFGTTELLLYIILPTVFVLLVFAWGCAFTACRKKRLHLSRKYRQNADYSRRGVLQQPKTKVFHINESAQPPPNVPQLNSIPYNTDYQFGNPRAHLNQPYFSNEPVRSRTINPNTIHF